jgi:hypothetical protein
LKRTERITKISFPGDIRSNLNKGYDPFFKTERLQATDAFAIVGLTE